jgi:DNA polymerase IV
MRQEQAEAIAISALSFIASDPERLDRFLAVTGLDPAALRAAAGAPGFLSGVLDYLCSDEGAADCSCGGTGYAARDGRCRPAGFLAAPRGGLVSAGAASSLCRDCLAPRPAAARRCHACGSPRLLAHPERDSLTIAHIDCDAFYAAVEKRDDPALRDKPLIVGGGRRGVVATCCYIARTFGVRSAMPMFKALALCPDAVVRKPDMARYTTVARQVREMMLDLTPQVEPLSIDEAFLDLAGTDRLHQGSPALTLARFARQLEKEIGITVSVGLSYCKFLAKIASDLDKPRGFAIIGRAQARAFLADKPVGLIWGVGAVAQERLARDGFRTIGDIQALSETDFMRRLGGEGQRLWRLANGVDDRSVSPERETKSVSAETTFEEDVSDAKALARVLLALSEKVSARLKASGLGGETITLKLKTADFRLRTRAAACRNQRNSPAGFSRPPARFSKRRRTERASASSAWAPRPCATLPCAIRATWPTRA